MTEPSTTDQQNSSFSPWEGSSVFVEQGRHWSSAFIWLTATLFTSSIIWAFTAKIDQSISVRGQLQPSGSVKEVESSSGGVIRQLFISEGDRVERGQKLLVVQSQGLISRHKAITERLTLLELEASSLLTIIDSNGDPDSFSPLPKLPVVSDSEFRSRLMAARNQTQQIRTQLKQISYRVQSQKQSLNLQKQIVADIKPLYEGGGISRNAYLQRLNTVQELQAQVSTLEAERSRLIGLTSATLNNINSQIIVLTSELDSVNEELSFRTINAPSDGTVFDLRASLSSVVNSNEVLLKIVPDNKLEAKVRILDSDIGFIKVGQPASVSVDSFPSGEFGYITGTLTSFGQDVLPPNRDNPVRYFPATINLNEQSVLSGDNQLNLQSGMGITANIKLRSRPVITILTDIFTRQVEGLKRFR